MELRRASPWRLIAHPVLRAFEFVQYESTFAAKLMPFEIIHFYMLLSEKNIVRFKFQIATFVSI